MLTRSYVNSAVSHNQRRLIESCSIIIPPILTFNIPLWNCILVWSSVVMWVDSGLEVSQKVHAYPRTRTSGNKDFKNQMCCIYIASNFILGERERWWKPSISSIWISSLAFLFSTLYWVGNITQSVDHVLSLTSGRLKS